MKTVLAFDTATEALSVALLHNGETRAHFELAPRLHAQKLLPLIEQMLVESGVILAQVDAFVFGRGPGAFTGVRTAVGVVQGLAFACERPVLGVSTLEAMAEGARRESGAQHVITAIDARMGEVYWAAWQYQDAHWRSICAECVVPPAQALWPEAALANEWMGVGSGWPAYATHLQAPAGLRCSVQSAIATYPHALDMLQLAMPRLQRGEGLPAHMAEPVYLRDQVADKPAPKSR